MDEIALGGRVEFVTWIRVMDQITLNRYIKNYWKEMGFMNYNGVDVW